MTAASLELLARRVSLAAGVLDLGTGLGLVFQPVFTLGLMGTTAPGAEALVQVRFVGTFVTAVGSCYLLALIHGRIATLRTMLAQTLLLRGAAGGYVTAACALGWLGPSWMTVAVTDLGLVIIQAFLLRSEMGRDG